MIDLNDGYHGWVKVENALPDDGEPVWIAHESNDGHKLVHEGWFNVAGGLNLFSFSGDLKTYYPKNVSHWMYVVEPQHPLQQILR